MNRSEILDALNALASELQSRGVQVELGLLGGAALVVMYEARESTKDVDAFVLKGPDAASVRAAAKHIAAGLGLPKDWLNDAAKGYVHGLALGDSILDTPSLVVRALAPQQLLAMKLSAWRDDVDIDDAKLLMSKLSGEREEMWNLIEPFVVPGRELKAKYAFDDLWEALHGSA